MITNHSNNRQLIIKENFIIPENKPDIETILRATAVPVMRKSITKGQFTLVYGDLNISAEYAARVPEGTQPVYFVTLRTTFADILRHNPEQTPENIYTAKVEYEDINAVSSRAINSFIILKIYRLNAESYQSSSCYRTGNCDNC